MNEREKMYNLYLAKRSANVPLTEQDSDLIHSAIAIMEQVKKQQALYKKFAVLVNDEVEPVQVTAQFLFEMSNSTYLLMMQTIKLLKFAGVDLGIDPDKPMLV